jgi:hypothetical protein
MTAFRNQSKIKNRGAKLAVYYAEEALASNTKLTRIERLEKIVSAAEHTHKGAVMGAKVANEDVRVAAEELSAAQTALEVERLLISGEAPWQKPNPSYRPTTKVPHTKNPLTTL